MRIPTDIPLAVYIRRLIRDNKIEKFYLSEDWKEKRQKVLEFFHFECQECLKKGKYTEADCVHHIREVKNNPELALSQYYINPETGENELNLIPLCNTCHNKIHDKLGNWQKKDKFTNEEKW